MASDDIKRAMKIPKRKTFEHYMRVVGELFAEEPALMDSYVCDQLKANDEKLDEAIECFVDVGKKAVEIGYKSAKEEEQKRIRDEQYSKPFGKNHKIGDEKA